MLQALRLEGNPLKMKNMWLFMNKIFGKKVNCQPTFCELIYSYSTWSRRMVILEEYKPRQEPTVVLKNEELSDL